MAAPVVTVIVVAYNMERFVAQTLDSVRDQVFDGTIELVVVDDCSVDGTAEAIEAWVWDNDSSARVLLHDENMGLCAGLNDAVRRSRGEFVVVIAADDWMHPDRLRLQIARMHEAGPSCGLVYSDLQYVDEGGNTRTPVKTRPPQEGDVYLALLRQNFIPAPAVLMRRSALEKSGPYDESLLAEDYDMWLQIASRFEIAYQPGRLVNYRVRDRSLSSTLSVEGCRNQIKVLSKHLGRSDEADAIIVPRIVRCAQRLYLGGSALDAEMRSMLRVSMSLAPSPRLAAFALLAQCRIPAARVRSVRHRFRIAGP